MQVNGLRAASGGERTREAPPAAAPAANALSVDVEEYFQVWAFAGRVRPADWDRYPSRIEACVTRLLELFAERRALATFFVLGWVARRHPALVRAIVAAGHELASHGLAHVRLDAQRPDEFRADIRETKALLEDVGGAPVRGYRAASFSMSARSPWAFQILAEEGHLYSSSVYPIRHDIYGDATAPRFAYRPAGTGGVLEIPISTLPVFGRNLPCGGGGYFRLLPYAYFRWAIRRINRHDGQPAIFYMHPWEIDPGQPRMDGVPLRSRFRHYVNLGAAEGRLRSLLSDFTWSRLDAVFDARLRGADPPAPPPASNPWRTRLSGRP